MKVRIVSAADRGRHPEEARELIVGDVIDVEVLDVDHYWYKAHDQTSMVLKKRNTKQDVTDFVGKTVRAMKNDMWGAAHPTEKRPLTFGDLVKIESINETLGLLNYVGYTGSLMSIYPEGVELIKETCSCKSLLNGHEFGCHFYKEL